MALTGRLIREIDERLHHTFANLPDFQWLAVRTVAE